MGDVRLSYANGSYRLTIEDARWKARQMARLLAAIPDRTSIRSMAVDDEQTVTRNHEAFSHLEVRSRRFVDVSRIDMMLKIFNTSWSTPVYLSAVANLRAFASSPSSPNRRCSIHGLMRSGRRPGRVEAEVIEGPAPIGRGGST
jgi:hypothetical protein